MKDKWQRGFILFIVKQSKKLAVSAHQNLYIMKLSLKYESESLYNK